ncbi:Ppx/GppA phosphatase family protein [Aneurinibacillus aneurinilyticus]|jgi:exopolyphosphatase/guanosine-5'-triphosphate,3'-diphosphate pyrophosphatase|uniref:Ppx/GppA phosphatase family protein n=1 Tax=Aneurinibacillus aneurinilyticus TaxID=1391 RepID=UPI0023F7FED0|nr:Ppx/GppA phosphatase family protein [Aneurinibacillus aneurinilyticus]MCI1693833.1 Ppx/GppA family phosphatase [Aneurinibacillus aneurinilyticus]MED0671994.1 Ppx/GppA phosphatase family protein [Aneurinibacillus aneurinilyticus]
MDKYRAVIDMGSNSVRLVIYYEAAEGASYEVDNIKNTIRLNTFLNERNEIVEQGIAEVIRVLTQYRQLCEARAVSSVTGVATATVRKARNKEEFLRRIREVTGFSFRVLSGEEEAYYGYLAVVNSMCVTEGFTIDIGGASSELVRISDRRLIESHSFPFGAVTLTRQFFQGEIPTMEELVALEKYITAQFTSYTWLRGKELPIVGMGGTVRNLAKIHQKMMRYPFASLHHYEMKKYQVDAVFHHLKDLSPMQMQGVEGLSKERADIVIAGIVIIKALLSYIGSERFIVSNKGLRDGVYMESRLKAKSGALVKDVIEEGIRALMIHYKVNVLHAQHVDYLCCTLFEQLATEGLHRYGTEERLLLSIAARLHDIGRTINLGEWQQHTFYLMVHVLLPGLTHKQRLLAALIASYKGSKRMQQLAASYESMITEGEQQMVEQLGALLLIGRALDRTESQQVSEVMLMRTSDAIMMHCRGNIDGRSLEAKTLEEHKKKFKKQFGFPLQIEWMKP